MRGRDGIAVRCVDAELVYALAPLAFAAGRTELSRPGDVAGVTPTGPAVHPVLEFVVDSELVGTGRQTVSYDL